MKKEEDKRVGQRLLEVALASQRDCKDDESPALGGIRMIKVVSVRLIASCLPYKSQFVASFPFNMRIKAANSSGRINKFRKTRVVIDENRSVIALSFPSSSQYETFRLTDNLLLISDRFISQGKFSVTLKQPKRVISFREISPVTAATVCRYLNCVKNGTKFNQNSSKIESLSNASITELLIERLKDYPVGSSFPTSLKNLHIKSIKLDSFDTRILRLTHLSILTIEGSNISAITKDIAKLSLVRLCLNSNSIVSWPSVSRESPLSSFLTHLDLSGNRITRLPMDFWNLENLETLNLNDNQLIGVPPVNLHRIRRLSNISLRNNQLRCLPFSFTCLQSPGTLDLSDNPWVTPSPPLIVTKFEPKSLFHYATVAFLLVYAKFCWWPSAVAKARWEEGGELPERIVTEALGVLRRCAVCLKVCGPESQRFVDAMDLRFSQRVVSAPSCVIHYCCSSRCALRFNPPLSTISV
ncbi:hypothetical protein ACTXT7_009816 [Hymenolepis weldensis]